MEDFATKSELETLKGIISDVAARQQETVSRTVAAEVAPSSGGFKWVTEVLDVGGVSVLPTSANDWSSYFDSPTVTKYTSNLDTASGDLTPSSARGLEGEYRWSLSFNSSVSCTMPVLLSYYTDSVAAKIQMMVNGAIVHNANFAGSTIIGTPLTISIKRGPNRITVAGDLFVDEVSLHTNAFLTKGFSTINEQS